MNSGPQIIDSRTGTGIRQWGPSLTIPQVNRGNRCDWIVRPIANVLVPVSIETTY
jgi:hypothetical protein